MLGVPANIRAAPNSLEAGARKGAAAKAPGILRHIWLLAIGRSLKMSWGERIKQLLFCPELPSRSVRR